MTLIIFIRLFFTKNVNHIRPECTRSSYRILFNFSQIENHDSCFYDYVEIRNGHSADSPLINKYCGYKLPLDVHSTTNKLYVKFLSDSSVQKAGFSATFMKGIHTVCTIRFFLTALVLCSPQRVKNYNPIRHNYMYYIF